MSSKIKLTYFDIKGRGEAIRLTFVAGGVEFEDERISGAEFAKRKSDGKLSFGSLPMMQVDGVTYAESGALLRYAGQVGGLTPSSATDSCNVDMVIDAVESVLVSAYKGSSAESRAKFVADDIPRYFGPIERTIAKTDGPFLLGLNISAADIKLAVMVDALKEGTFEHVPTDCVDKYIAINGVYSAVMEHERIKKYYAA